MVDKTLAYLELADHAAHQITSSYQEWTGFLAMMGRIYKYPYNEQLLIYAQRPDATACAEYNLWNKQMRRYVMREAKGIALIDTSTGENKVRYVFDVSDTGERENARRPWLWQYRPEHQVAVSSALAERYGVSGENGLADQLEKIAGQLAREYWKDNEYDLLHIVDGSFLEGYDDYNIQVAFRNAAAVSITYALMSRCGLEPEEYFTHEDFLDVFDFNTQATTTALGKSISQGSEQVLRQIEVTIKKFEREKRAERSTEHGKQPDLYPGGGRSAAQPDPARTSQEELGQVRPAAPELSEGTPPGAVGDHEGQRDVVQPPVGGGKPGQRDAGADDALPGADGGGHGGTESQGPHDLGGTDERLQSPSGGDYLLGTDLQLNTQPDTEGPSVKTPGPSTISQEDIDAELCWGSGYGGGKLRIYGLYQHSPTPKEAIAFLNEEYSDYGHSHTFLDGRRGFVNYSSSKGMEIQSYGDGGSTTTIKWPAIEKRLRMLVTEGNYLTETERDRYTEMEHDFAGLGGVPMPKPRYGFPKPDIPASEPFSKPVMNDYNATKAAHPDDIVLFQMGDFFEMYSEDAKQAAELLGLHLTTRNIPNVGRVEMCGVPSHDLERYVEKLREQYDVTLSAIPEGGTERGAFTLRSIDHEAERAIDAHEAEFGADGTRVFHDPAAEEPAPIVRELYDKYKPVVTAAVMEDMPYRNACGHSDHENAVTEGSAAIKRAILNSHDLELIRLYSDVPEFRSRLHQEIIGETYPQLHELLRPLSQADIDEALQSWNGNLDSKRRVVRYMEEHGRERSAAEWLSREYGGAADKNLFIIRQGSPETVELSWPKVQRRIA